ncbi:hypothetical protein [Chromobacterium vaccinii]|uniref:hypothetical protein n=1 Tax=Chromobacterium vaccinii TaxID=1108595 RepID=UPI000E1FBBCD|nr:hypothetical protein [Chromobacterium vaccinii]
MQFTIATPPVEAAFPRILYIEQVSSIIGKTVTTIRTCATNEKYKHLIPRPFKMPHSRRLAWYEKDVLAWLADAPPVSPPVKRRRGRPTKIEQLARIAGDKR